VKARETSKFSESWSDSEELSSGVSEKSAEGTKTSEIDSVCESESDSATLRISESLETINGKKTEAGELDPSPMSESDVVKTLVSLKGRESQIRALDEKEDESRRAKVAKKT
jgi:hypothetical protein